MRATTGGPLARLQGPVPLCLMGPVSAYAVGGFVRILLIITPLGPAARRQLPEADWIRG